MENARTSWRYIERLLIDECGLRPDEGLAQQRPNFIVAVAMGRNYPPLVAAAVEFLSAGDGLHKLRVKGRLMTRKQVADALRAKG